MEHIVPAKNKLYLFLIAIAVLIPVLGKSEKAFFSSILENDSLCNDAISGPLVNTYTETDALCVGCTVIGESNMVNGDLNDFALVSLLVSPLGQGVELGVISTEDYYPGGNETGFVLSSSTGILDLTTLGALTISTYLNGVPQESATIGNGLLDVSLLAGDASRQKVSIETTLDFDEVHLYVDGGLVGATLNMYVYYAFEQPAGLCDNSCMEALTATSSYGASINNGNTGLGGICVLCSVSDTPNVTDGDTTNFGNISLPIGVLGSGSISVETTSPVPAGYEAGFVVRDGDGLLGLLDVQVLDQIYINTYLAGVPQESYLASNFLVSAFILEGTTDLVRIGFKTTEAFDEIQFTAYGLVSLGLNIDVFHAYVVADSDNDGIADCLDQCALGDDLVDTDQDGIPDACDDVTTCEPSGEEILEDNGICNDAITGVGTTVESQISGLCLLCSVLDEDNVVDGDLGNFADINIGVSALGEGVTMTVTDTVRYYPGGYEAGFVLGSGSGLLDASVLGSFTIRTYKDGLVQESATTGNGLLNLSALQAGPLPRYRVGFTTTLDFDAVEIFVNGGLLSALLNLRVYYAYEQPTSCGDACIQALTSSSNGAAINGSNTGLSGICILCDVSGTADVVDTDTTNNGQISLALGALVTGSMSVGVTDTFPAGTTVGYVVEDDSGLLGLLDAQILGQITLTTYLGGSQQESVAATSSLVGATVLPGTSALNALGFTVTAPFDEVQISVAGLLGLGIDLNIYYAWVVLDADSDGVADCNDQCLAGSDLIDLDGDGIPDACDPYVGCECEVAGNCLDAIDNFGTVNEMDTTIVDVLPNDIINVPIDTSSLAVVSGPDNGTATVLVDGTIEYVPDTAFVGIDSFQYVICTDEMTPTCDSAWVFMTVEAMFVRLDLKVLLQGALYGVVDTIMYDSLRSQSLIPTTEPYTSLTGFTHVNGGFARIDDPGSILADLGDSSVVDWVFVELRDPADSTLILSTRSALVLRNGDVVDSNGEPLIWFNLATPAEYHVSVRHRNHLGVMTAQSVSLTTAGTTVDFTDTTTDFHNNQANYDGFEQATINGKYALWAGNALVDGKVVFAGQDNDIDDIYNEVIFAPGNLLNLQTYQFNGYNPGDINTNGDSVFAGQANDVDPVFNNIDGFGPNLLKLQTFIMYEQLPE
ncbi:MAG: hypothetical protein GYB31_04880 [Bacteroidetes bacterium]|nr:hypothetical protein [Bacteroidota bacterium]